MDVDDRRSWRTGSVMGEEGHDLPDAAVAEAVCSEQTSLHSGADGCLGVAPWMRREIGRLVVEVEGRSGCYSVGVHNRWRM